MDDRTQPDSDIDIVALVRGKERYIVIYRPDNAGPAYRALGRWAANPELSFNWQDAGTLYAEISDNAREVAQ